MFRAHSNKPMNAYTECPLTFAPLAPLTALHRLLASHGNHAALADDLPPTHDSMTLELPPEVNTIEEWGFL
jgi:hypothetical protein